MFTARYKQEVEGKRGATAVYRQRWAANSLRRKQWDIKKKGICSEVQKIGVRFVIDLLLRFPAERQHCSLHGSGGSLWWTGSGWNLICGGQLFPAPKVRDLTDAFVFYPLEFFCCLLHVCCRRCRIVKQFFFTSCSSHLSNQVHWLLAGNESTWSNLTPSMLSVSEWWRSGFIKISQI